MSVNREVHDYIVPENNFEPGDNLEQQSLNVDNIVANLGNISVQNVVEVPFSASAELSRKQIIDKNIKVLRKRFGDEFVKGERLDSGGYADGGARELLATFLEYPDAAERIKRLIPNKHQALTTLHDNNEYIIDRLTQDYRQESRLEQEQPQDPYELAKNAGYELTGPFEDADSFKQYIQDFRPDELLCTYDDPESRLSAYHISWLRRPNAAEIMPADELTEDNLCDNWKSYLKANKRYDAETDSYNLTGLQPAREDPYGTSSMSVQVSRFYNHVSIKNRYNHTVPNPDNTYNSNLDNISYGLRLGLYHQLGCEDLLDEGDYNLHSDYVLDNNGGIHRYYQEEGSRYLGYYEYIENGVVTNIDKGAYDMISPAIYVGKNQQAEVMVVSGESVPAMVETLDDGTRNLLIYDFYDKLQQTYSYNAKQRADIMDVQLTVAEGTWTDRIQDNPALVKLNILEGAKVGDIIYNPSLTELNIAKKARVTRIQSNESLEKLKISEEAKVEMIGFNSDLARLHLHLADLAEVDYISNNRSLVKLSIDDGAKVGHIIDNHSLTELNTGKKVTIKEIAGNQILAKLIIPEGAEVGQVAYSPSLTELIIDSHATVNYVFGNSALAKLNISEAAEVGNISQNQSLTELNLDKKATIGDISRNSSLTKLNIEKDASVKRVAFNESLTELYVGKKAKVETIDFNDILANLTIDEGAEVREVVGNPSLNELSIGREAKV